MELTRVRINLQTQTNILIDDSGRVRISDFGLAVYDIESSSGHFNGGTTRWMSPERLDPETRSVKATFSSDVYSFAMVIYEVSEQFFLPWCRPSGSHVLIQIYSGHIPFYSINNFKAILEVISNRRPVRDFNIPDDLWFLTERCWAAEPSKRPQIEEIVTEVLGRNDPDLAPRPT